MSPKKLTPPTPAKQMNAAYIKTVKPSSRKNGVMNFADFQGEESHKRFDTMIDQTVYIVKLEPSFSDTYGEGWKVYFKDIPGEKATYDCNVYGTYVVPQLRNLYVGTKDGQNITELSPVRAVIRKAGNSYKFE